MGDLKLQPQRDKIRSGVETKTVPISPVLGYIAEIELNIDFQPNFAYWLIIVIELIKIFEIKKAVTIFV